MRLSVISGQHDAQRTTETCINRVTQRRRSGVIQHRVPFGALTSAGTGQDGRAELAGIVYDARLDGYCVTREAP
ncbi:hypothetical protein BQ8482_111060 [Mesorhizobium delmotii]|uniref:Uncharacterized protein n=1 Tax=Mesorhizobium delmotii TaxID=1631247 RepID=A0A2P9ADD3_9HYPH|nr:hypothetical protein BQ8482_111060 [Mesorhizobium delmotii]